MLKTLKNTNVRGKRVLVRVDFNVPIDNRGKILDDFKIRCSLETIKYLKKKKAKQIILMSHLDPWKDNPASGRDLRLRMDSVAEILSKLIKGDVVKMHDCVDVKLPSDYIILLENLRFHKEEEKNDKKFAKKLAKNGDVYVNDAFGTCHRAHASVDSIVKYFKNYCAGLLVEKEVKMLYPVLKNPKHPFYFILGGAKIASKIGVIEKFGKIADKIFIGGKMSLAFLDIPYIDKEDRLKARKLNKKYFDKIFLPVDFVLDDKKILDVRCIPKNKKIFDIGPITILLWKRIISDAKMVVWNGPLGYFEKKPFDRSTNEIAKYLSKKNLDVIIGGGDSENAVRKLNLGKKIHVSTGGGASLEFLEGKKLPGLKVLGFYS